MESTIRSWKSKYVQFSHGNFDILVILELSYYNFNFLDTLVFGEYFNGLCDSILTYGRRGKSEWAACARLIYYQSLNLAWYFYDCIVMDEFLNLVDHCFPYSLDTAFIVNDSFWCLIVFFQEIMDSWCSSHYNFYVTFGLWWLHFGGSLCCAIAAEA